jgi:hypothetical protein
MLVDGTFDGGRVSSVFVASAARLVSAARLQVTHTSPHVANCAASCSVWQRLHVRVGVLNLAT